MNEFYEIGQRLLLIRLKNHATRKVVAEFCRVSQPTLYDVERGRCAPSIKLVSGFAKMFGVTTDLLIFGEDNDYCEELREQMYKIKTICERYSQNDNA